MINNLKKSGNISKKVDIAIIGAGTVGIIISSLLKKNGFSTITLESGGWTQKNKTNLLNKVICKKSLYSSASRFRCLGGTSTVWGGAMLPFVSKDMFNEKWPVKYEEIIKYKKDIENIFSLSKSDYEDRNLFYNDLNFSARLCKYPDFKNRNIFNIFIDELKSTKGPEIFINATVTQFLVQKKKLKQITAYSNNGNKLSVEAKEFIITAGAIESTRLALELNRQNNYCISKNSPFLGKNFSDHLSIPIATIHPKNIEKINKIFAHRFDTKSKLRIELKENSKIRNKVPPFFFHITPFVNEKKSAHFILRKILSFKQNKNSLSFKDLINFVKFLPWIFKAFWWFIYYRRLLFDKNSKLKIHLVIEQTSSLSNKISLNKIKKDIFNMPLAEIHWQINKIDIANFIKSINYINTLWNSSFLSELGDFIKIKKKEIIKKIKKHGGIYHPAGSTKMSYSPKNGVVNKNLQIFSVKNTRIISTSVFPTTGGTHPTMTLLMLAIRCSNQLIKKNSKHYAN